jgi:hypothetical protein
MAFHIEGNSLWATKFNSQMLKCHEIIDSNERFNFESYNMVTDESEEESN